MYKYNVLDGYFCFLFMSVINEFWILYYLFLNLPPPPKVQGIYFQILGPCFYFLLSLPQLSSWKRSRLHARPACLRNLQVQVLRLLKVSEIGRKVRKLDQSRDFFAPEFMTWRVLSASRITRPNSSLAAALQGDAGSCRLCRLWVHALGRT